MFRAFLMSLPFLLSPAMASDSFEPLSGIEVAHVCLAPGSGGGAALLAFEIENFSGKPVRLTGISTPGAEVQITLQNGAEIGGRDISFFIDEEEVLDFGSEHLDLKLSTLEAPFSPDSNLELSLEFASAGAVFQTIIETMPGTCTG